MNNNNSLPGPHEPDSTRPALPARALHTLVPVRASEAAAAGWSAAYFFCLLFGYYLLRPIRETFGIKDGPDDLPWLWTATTVTMLAASPIFAWLVSRMPRRRFIPLTYRFFATNLLAFYAALLALPEHHLNIGYVFYVWLSVFNLFSTSLFWGFMSDLWTSEQSRRLFGAIAVGGTIGAICGSAVVSSIPKPGDAGAFNTAHFIPLSVVLLEAAVFCVRRLVAAFGLAHSAPAATSALDRPARPEPSPAVWRGFALIARSPYLVAMALYMLLFTVANTFLYFEQSRAVHATFHDDASRTTAFARIDLAVNVLTLVTQLFITGHIVRTLGVVVGLAVVPLVTIAGFTAIALAPDLGWPLFLTVAVVQVSRRSMSFAIDRPSREMLYTPLGPDEKYKAKSFIDTFVYRAGDLLGIWTRSALTGLSWSNLVAVGVGAISLGLGFFLAAGYRRALARRDPAQ